ncbi:MAG: NAD-dependent epimerase/dehydratase family protein, partial [Candidatus Thorarchaeota archaeon]
LLNRGLTDCPIPGVNTLNANIRNKEETKKILENKSFDIVVDWIAYSPQDLQTDYELFYGKIKQFIFISSASAYQKPLKHHIITESTPLVNPYWQYSRNKIACEELLTNKYRETDFPITIVRPSHTYATLMPVIIGSGKDFTIMDRMLKGKEVIIHGDGTSLWVLTHSEDFAKGFVGLLGNYHAIGHTFHITSDEVLTWNQIYQIIADELGVEAKIVHIPSDYIAQFDKNIGESLLGDKAYSVIFDNTKIKTFVPEFRATIPFTEGVKKVLSWFNEKKERMTINKLDNELIDKIITTYKDPIKNRNN